MNAIWRGWSIAKASWTVLRKEPRLAILPVCALLAVIAALVGAVFLIVAVARHPGFLALDESLKLAVAAFELLAAYLFCCFIVIFFNVALVSCALRYFDTGTVSIAEGLAAAARRAPQIFGWTLIAATVGLILRFISNLFANASANPISSLVGTILGGAPLVLWIAATYFVLPVLVVEGVGPIAACRRSAALIKARWRDVIGGETRFGLLILALVVPYLVVAGLLLAPEGVPSDLVMIPLLAIGAVYGFALTVVFTTLGAVFLAAVYKFADTGTSPPAFGPDLVATALRTRQA